MATNAELVLLTGNAEKHSRSLADDTPLLLREQAYLLIKADIIQCRLKPGSEVSEAILAKRYNFGKAPIRAALSKLSQDGLVVPRSRRGYVVVPITTKYVQETYELRMILEPAAARAAVGNVDIANLRKLCTAIRYPDDPAGTLEFLETHHAFHVAIARMSGNERLAQIVSSLLTDMARLIHLTEFSPDRDTQALILDQELQMEQHMSIVEALSVGDPELAETAVRKHIEHSAKMTREAVFASRLSVDLSS